jgi:hypothetical protein
VAAWALYFRDDPRQHPGVVEAELPCYLPHRKSIAGIPWLPLLKRILPGDAGVLLPRFDAVVYLNWLPSFFADTYRLSMALISSAVFFAGMIGDTVGGLVTDAATW